MKAEILSTGDEIISGALIDSNSAWLSEKLLDLGVTTRRHTCVGDSLTQLTAILQEMSKRADLVLVTGGLGPTTDDLSAQAAAEATRDRLVLNEPALKAIQAFFEKRDRVMSESNRKQAMFPSRATVIENLWGTAPGFSLDFQGCLFVFMPGVPYEMKHMFKAGVLPMIQSRFPGRDAFLAKRYTLFGMPESEVSQRLDGFLDRFPEVRLGFRASFPLIEVKFSCSLGSADRAQNEKQMVEAGQFIKNAVGHRLVSDAGLTLEQEVGRLLTQGEKTVAAAESCTGGLLAHLITSTPGSSDYFLFSGVTYANEAKVNVLGVNPETLASYGAVHEKTAQEMAEGARKVSGADYAVSTSGVAGPGGGSEDKPVGTVCIGLAGPGFSRAKRYYFPFAERGMNKKIFAAMALELLRRELA